MIFIVVIIVIIVIIVACIGVHILREKSINKKIIKPLKQLSLNDRKKCYSDLKKLQSEYLNQKSDNREIATQSIIRSLSQTIMGDTDERRIENLYGIKVDEYNISFYISEIKKLL